MDTAAGESDVQVSRLLDEGGLTAFHVKLIAWSVLIALIDGYDLAVTAYVAPHLVTDWGVPRSALGPVLSASGFGILFGSQIFGWLGDRYGRKPALIAANLLFGVFTFAAVPVVGSIGYAGLTSPAALLTATFFAGFFVLGIQTAINVLGAMIYPTSLRANGSGWQLGLGRFGAIGGPLSGAAFIGLPVAQLYMWLTLPLAAGAVVCFVIYLLLQARAARPSAMGERVAIRNR